MLGSIRHGFLDLEPRVHAVSWFPRYRSTKLGPFSYRYFPFSPMALKHRERQRGCALRHGVNQADGLPGMRRNQFA